jgi:hypothetical protein
MHCGVDLGSSDPPDTLQKLLETDEVAMVLPLADERFMHLPAPLDGRTFTHRLIDTEVAREITLRHMSEPCHSVPWGQETPLPSRRRSPCVHQAVGRGDGGGSG